VAISGIPPLNGFVSEFLLYLGFFRQLTAGSLNYLVLLAPLLALVGGLAVVAFTKLYSSVFLGSPRSAAAATPHEAGLAMQMPMAFFALLCLLVGFTPQLALRFVSPAVTTFYPQVLLAAVAAETDAILGRLSLVALLLLSAVVVIALLWKWRLAQKTLSFTATWGCGYQRGTPRMQYNVSSFSELAVSVFNGIIRQRIVRPHLTGLFPAVAHCSDTPTETLLERIITPVFSGAGMLFGFLHRLQHGLIHIYMLYIFATLLILMLWAN
jgi:hydrogenase-4 component B